MTNNIMIDIDYLIETLKKMISINSVLPNEQQLSEFIADEIKSFGIEPEWHEIAPGRPNIYAEVDFGSSNKFLVFSGHSDTVDAASDWETDPFEPVVKNGRLYGLGAINMKAGLACSLAAFKALVEFKENYGKLGRVGLAITVDQEGHSIGAEAMLKTKYGKCDAMLHAEHFFGDSKENYLPIAVTGKVLYKLTIKGKSAHAFRPHPGGINAVEDASKIISSLEKLKLRNHPLFGKGTVCTLKIDGGFKQYSMVVPYFCKVIITRLTIPGETRDIAVQDMQDLIDSLKLKSEVQIETPSPHYDPYFLDENLPFISRFKEVYREVLGKYPYFAGHRGIVDANVFVAKGKIPTIVFGPKGANHHQAGEYVEISSLEQVARIYAEMTIRYF